MTRRFLLLMASDYTIVHAILRWKLEPAHHLWKIYITNDVTKKDSPITSGTKQTSFYWDVSGIFQNLSFKCSKPYCHVQNKDNWTKIRFDDAGKKEDRLNQSRKWRIGWRSQTWTQNFCWICTSSWWSEEEKNDIIPTIWEKNSDDTKSNAGVAPNFSLSRNRHIASATPLL